MATGLKWSGGGGYREEEKMDGVWAVKSEGSNIIVGEQMKDGRFFAFDVCQYKGQDVRSLPLIQRIAILDAELSGDYLRPAVGHGAEFLEAVLSRGGEGVVSKYLDAPFGQPWAKCKRVETFDLVVTEKLLPSIRLSTCDGEDRGWCKARSDFESIAVGSIVEIAAYSLTANGKLREPRFVRIRHDKALNESTSKAVGV